MERGIEEIFSPIDIYFAKAFLPSAPISPEFILLCYLSASSRHGNLCICLKEKTLSPHPNFLTVEEEEISFLQELVEKAFFSLPEALCYKVDLEESMSLKPIYLFQGALYLQRNYWIEKEFALHLTRLLAFSRPLSQEPVISAFLNA